MPRDCFRPKRMPKSKRHQLHCMFCGANCGDLWCKNKAVDLLTCADCAGERQRWQGKGQGWRDRRSGAPNSWVPPLPVYWRTAFQYGSWRYAGQTIGDWGLVVSSRTKQVWRWWKMEVEQVQTRFLICTQRKPWGCVEHWCGAALRKGQMWFCPHFSPT